MSRLSSLLLGLLLLLGLAAAALWFWGSRFIAPHPQSGSRPVTDLALTDVQFDGVSGWYVASTWPQHCVILMHGLHGSRLNMLPRAEFLVKAGYSVLLFDFQGHGQTPGSKVSFGYREAWDAMAAVRFMRRQQGCQRLGVIGISMGAAASLLGEGPLPVDAFILESLYGDIRSAVSNRLQLQLGDWGRRLEPLMSYQIPLRLYVSLDKLKPLSVISQLKAPLLLLHGTADRHTQIEEAQELFALAPNPKFFWPVIGAAHQDLYRYSPEQYQAKVLAFLKAYLD